MAINSTGIPPTCSRKIHPTDNTFLRTSLTSEPRLGQSCGGRIHAVLNRATWPVVVDGILCRLSDFGAVAYEESKNGKRAHPFVWCGGKEQVGFGGNTDTCRGHAIH